MGAGSRSTQDQGSPTAYREHLFELEKGALASTFSISLDKIKLPFW